MGPQIVGKIYTLVEGQWVLSETEVKIPEGWWAVPPSFVSKEFEDK